MQNVNSGAKVALVKKVLCLISTPLQF